MNETQQTPTTPRKRSHRLLADDRGEITVSGVTEVLSFDDENVRHLGQLSGKYTSEMYKLAGIRYGSVSLHCGGVRQRPTMAFLLIP